MAPKSSQRQIAERVLALLRPSYHATYKAVDENLRDFPVSTPARGLLQLLSDGRPRTAPQIARELRIPRQFALQMVNEVLPLELVHQSQNPDHKRSHLVAISQSGRSLIDTIRAQEWAIVRPLATRLSQDDLLATERVLTELIGYFDALRGAE